MTMFEKPSFGSDNFQVGAAEESQLGLYLQNSNDFQLAPALKQDVCSTAAVPTATVDDVVIWFDKQVPDTWSGQVVFHQSKIQGELQEPCLPVESRASLQFLDDHFQMLAAPKKEKYQDRITSESMDVFKSWVVANQQELRLLEQTAPAHSKAINFLHDNFTLLDSNKDSKLSREEVDSAKKSGSFIGSDMLGLRQLDQNFNDMAAHALFKRNEIPYKLFSDVTGGSIGKITPASVTRFMLDRNNGSNSFDFIDGVTGIEMLRFNQVPGRGMIDHPSPYYREIENW